MTTLFNFGRPSRILSGGPKPEPPPEKEPSIMDFLPIAMDLQIACSRLRVDPPALRFPASSGYKIGMLAINGTTDFSLVPARTDEHYRFQLGGIWFEWNDAAAQRAKFRAGMDAAMSEFAAKENSE